MNFTWQLPHSLRVEIRVFPHVINANVRNVHSDKANKWPEIEEMKTETK